MNTPTNSEALPPMNCSPSSGTPIIIMTAGGKSSYRSHPDMDARDERTKVMDYLAICEKQYGKHPTDYEKGVVQGLECALSFLPNNQ